MGSRKKYMDSIMATEKCIILREVIIQPLPEKFRQCGIQITPNQSFKNAGNCIINLDIEGYQDLRYVVGLSSKACQHAVVRCGDNYFDLEDTTGGSLFYSCWELSIDQLAEFVLKNERHPELLDTPR